MTLHTAELMCDQQGRPYHLRLRPEEIADTIILVGDPARSTLIGQHFDSVVYQQSYREFVAITGEFSGKKLTVISTGIGCGGIDIVMNELDALVNLDWSTGLPKSQHTKLQFYRFGTTGGIQESDAIGSMICSRYAVAFDGLLNFYERDIPSDQHALHGALQHHFDFTEMASNLYVTGADKFALDKMSGIAKPGMTMTCAGFYAPQGRSIRATCAFDSWVDSVAAFAYEGMQFNNFEMETAAIYGLASVLGHSACSVSCVIGNRHHNNVGQCEDIVASCLSDFLSAVSE